jgi:hypothetical protein
VSVVDFTPLTAAAGGALIGAAAVMLLALNGRLAGVSGILARVLEGSADRAWRVAFLVGLVLGAGVWYALGGAPPHARAGFPAPLLAAAGVLVGFGTALSNGCTSGHGVCGLGRLSLRSLVATLAFLATAVATTYVTRHIFGVH